MKQRRFRQKKGESTEDFKKRWLEGYTGKPISVDSFLTFVTPKTKTRHKRNKRPSPNETISKCIVCGIMFVGVPFKKYCNECAIIHGKLLRTIYMANRRRKMSNIIHSFTTKEWIDKLKLSSGYCKGYKFPRHYVGIENLTLDHIFPVSKVVENTVYTINDVQPLCLICNIRKGNKIFSKHL